LAGFISNLDSHVVEGSGWQVVPEVAKIARQVHGLGADFMDVGQVHACIVSVKTVAVMDMKKVLGHASMVLAKGPLARDTSTFVSN
jgi:hypothetical protein